MSDLFECGPNQQPLAGRFRSGHEETSSSWPERDSIDELGAGSGGFQSILGILIGP
jgi:hypothetical protein